MPAVIGALRAELSAQIAQFTDDMGKAADSVAGFQKRFSSIGKSMQKTGAVMSVAVTAPLVALGKMSLDAFQESENAVAAVDAALKSMGEGAGYTSKQLQDMAAKLQSVSTFDDDNILSKVTANLLTFGNVQGEVFARAQQSVLDLSARLGTDLQSSAIQVGKALNDPIKGITALQRVGVSFSEQQKETIKSLVETGQVAQAQGMILAELERQFGGQAAAAASTTAGQTAQLANEWGNFKEQIGEVIAQILPSLVEMLRGVVEWLKTLSPETIKWVVAIGGVAAAVGPVLVVLGSLITTISAVMPIIAAVGGAIAALGAGPLVAIVAAIGAVVAAWYYWDDIVGFVQGVVEGVKTWLMDKLNAVFEWVKGAIDSVTQAFEDMYTAVVGSSYVPDMIDGIAAEFDRLPDVMTKPTEDATSSVEDAFSKTGDRVGSLLGDMVQTGKFSFDSLKSMAADLSKELFIAPFLNSLGGSGGGDGGGILGGFASSLLNSFAGGFATGGTIPRGGWGIVGENGPEPVFAGDKDLTVMPNESMRGGSTTQNFYITTPDANSFRMSQRQIARSAKQRLQLA